MSAGTRAWKTPLTVWLGGAMFTFPAGREATVGRAVDADIRIDAAAHKQAISRTHMVLRAEDTGWVAYDKSRNGIYVDGTKAPRVDITDDTVIALGAAEGPKLSFRVTTQEVRPVAPRVPPSTAAQPAPQQAPSPPRQSRQQPPPSSAPAASAPPQQHRTPQHRTPPPAPAAQPPSPRRQPLQQQPRPRHIPDPSRQAPPPQQRTARQQPPPVRRQPIPPPRQPQPTPPPPQPVPAPVRPQPSPPKPSVVDEDEDLVGRLTGVVKKVLPARPAAVVSPGDITIGRASTNTVVIDDPLVSRVHAVAAPVPGGWQLRDNSSRNGTFVNGARISDAVLLRPGDAIAVGNVDLVFDGATISRRTMDRVHRGIAAHGVGFSVDGHQLLTNVSFTARPGTLTAVIGPSGAGKSTLIRLVGGQTTPTAGAVIFDGHNLHGEFAALRSRIGVVPQDDVVHRQLTVEQALRYAAQLRLPPDTSRADRNALIDRVLDELELTEHRSKRVDKLSGGQRKRASVAMELLTGPSLLILDEPTSGLDPALDRQVMSMLRRLADAGRVVIVVTHSLTYMNMCDQVLLLAPGGKTAYAGPPRDVAATLGTDDWADIFAWASSDPDGAHRAYLARTPAPPPPPAVPPGGGEAGEPASTSTSRQMFTVARRQIRLMAADRGYFAFLLVLPFLLGVLALVVPGDVGLGMARADSDDPGEPNQLLVLLNIAAVFMGTALTIRDLVGERNIFRREQSVGLSATAYLAAKVVVYAVAAAAQAAVLTAIVIAGKGGPQAGAVLFGSANFELYLTLAATAIVSAMVGLALSALARTAEQILPLLVAIVFLSIVFAGGMIPITGRVVLDQLSWFLPARWGFAAGASTMDLLQAAPLLNVDDPLWRHSPGWWLLDMGVLLGWGVVAIVVVAWRIRLPSTTRPARRWLAVVVIVVLAAGFVAALSYLTREGGPRDVRPPGPLAGMPTQGPAPEQEPVSPQDLAGLLLDGEALSSVLNASGLASAEPVDTSALAAQTAEPPHCLAVVAAGTEASYRDTGFTGVAGRTVSDPGDDATSVSQFVVSFPDAAAAARYQDSQINQWRDCVEVSVTQHIDAQPPRTWTVNAVDPVGGVLDAVIRDNRATCQRAVATDSNVVVDVLACSPQVGQYAEDIATQITDKIS
ncbi:sensor domain-containing protein [Mycolicibacterium thermoresistibile]